MKKLEVWVKSWSGETKVFGVIINLVPYILRMKTSYTDQVQAKDENRKLDLEFSRLVFELSTPAVNRLISSLLGIHPHLLMPHISSLKPTPPPSKALYQLSQIHISTY
jgi:hypothetical protein